MNPRSECPLEKRLFSDDILSLEVEVHRKQNAEHKARRSVMFDMLFQQLVSIVLAFRISQPTTPNAIRAIGRTQVGDSMVLVSNGVDTCDTGKP